MWLAKRLQQNSEPAAPAAEGIISLGGAAPAVVTDGEMRNMTVISPGGYAWLPLPECRAAVLRDPDRLLGVEQESTELLPGEVKIFSPAASIRLGCDGSIRLEGTVYINGERWVPHGSGSEER